MFRHAGTAIWLWEGLWKVISPIALSTNFVAKSGEHPRDVDLLNCLFGLLLFSVTIAEYSINCEVK